MGSNEHIVYPNQKEIYIVQADNGTDFVKMYSVDYQRASRDLNGGAFKLYVYLCDSRHGHYLALSGEIVREKMGLTIDTYQAAVKTLGDAGYLVHENENLYEFYARPDFQTDDCQCEEVSDITLYTNQKEIHITKGPYVRDFLKIGIDEWKEAAKVLNPSTFLLYMYLSSNANGYEFGLSQAKATAATGISGRTYHRAVGELMEKEYIVHIGKDSYDFCPSGHKNFEVHGRFCGKKEGYHEGSVLVQRCILEIPHSVRHSLASAFHRFLKSIFKGD